MPRRRFRLTMRKKKSTKTLDLRELDDYGAPTDAEYQDWSPFGTFVVSDQEGEKAFEHQFKLGDIALILPHDASVEDTKGMDDSEYWVGKIRDIRAPNDSNVWAKVQWYYSPSDVACVIKSFKTEACGEYERIFSDHYDYVHVDSFSGITTMTRFGFDDPIGQKYIGRKEFYCRYHLERNARWLSPNPDDHACPICLQPYSPDDSDPQHLMHFCPRPACRKFYHESCLESQKGLTEGARTLQLLMTWPDEDKKVTIADMLSYTRKPRGRKKGAQSQANVGPEETWTTISSFLDSLPTEVIKVAEQPIVRGATFRKGGITGNISYVVPARKMVYEVLRGSSIPDDWSTHINVVRSIVKIQVGAKKKPMLPFLCPECNSVI